MTSSAVVGVGNPCPPAAAARGLQTDGTIAASVGGFLSRQLKGCTRSQREPSPMKTRIFSIFVFAVLVSASGFAQKVNVDWDRGTDFSKFHTYAWQPSTHPAKGLWDQRIIDAVNQQLQAKGFQLVQSNPQLWVVYSNSIKKDQQVVGTGYNMGPAWGWGYGWGGPTTTTYQTYTTKEGTLIVEIADANGRQLL